ncbi:hypothetical protein [Arenimonas daejeonensis]|uniref:hypothetical protein n=1 Tax=Arenimonas daejeonensis TaxID=370777 RepID=UPI0011BEECBF|nr:hypothetical protein [Arenimonas daejeonensis]
MPRWIWFLLAIGLAALLWASRQGPGHLPAQALPGSPPITCVLPPSPLSGEEPLQTGVPATMRDFRLGDFVVSPLAGFSLEARVLSRRDYGSGPESALSPTDLALGWRRMSDRTHYQRLDISQSGRWYHYRWGADGPPLPLPEIIRSSANMHPVPADARVAQALSRVRPDQTVRLQGWLIEARRDDGWRWRSSLTRDDSGDGACELIYVCALTAF